jgi:hypothetical protein
MRTRNIRTWEHENKEHENMGTWEQGTYEHGNKEHGDVLCFDLNGQLNFFICAWNFYTRFYTRFN